MVVLPRTFKGNLVSIGAALSVSLFVVLIGYWLSGGLDNVSFLIWYIVSVIIVAAAAIVFAVRAFRSVNNGVIRDSIRFAFVVFFIAFYVAISFLLLVNINELLGRGI